MCIERDGSLFSEQIPPPRMGLSRKEIEKLQKISTHCNRALPRVNIHLDLDSDEDVEVLEEFGYDPDLKRWNLDDGTAPEKSGTGDGTMKLLEEAFKKRLEECKEEEENELTAAENIEFVLTLDGQDARDLLEESVEKFTRSKEEDV